MSNNSSDFLHRKPIHVDKGKPHILSLCIRQSVYSESNTIVSAMSKQTYINNAFVGDDGKNGDNGVYDKSKVFQLEAVEKAQNDFQIDKEYDPFAHRQVEHPIT